MTVAAPDRHGRQTTIQVVGDPTIDWMLVVPDIVAPVALHASYQWEARLPVQIMSQPGGAALLHMLVAAMSDPTLSNHMTVHGPMLPAEALVDPAHSELTRTYSLWQPYLAGNARRDAVWRMHQFLGMQRGEASAIATGPSGDVPDCLVIDDANFGFRDDSSAWPDWLNNGVAVRHLLLKMSNPLASGRLWDQIVSAYRDVLTLYCSAGDLRKEYAPVGQPLSWERMGSDVVRAVRARQDVSAAARVIVSIGMNGAVLIERDGPATLIYDPAHQEGDWERARPGNPVGLGTCVTAALALAVARNPNMPDWPQALAAGMDAGRMLHEQRRIQPDALDGSPPTFPTTALAEHISLAPATCFKAVAISEDDGWHIFDSVMTDSYRTIASRIVIEGDAEACRDLPIERIGAWSSIDRTEIESLRSVRNIIREYMLQTQRSRPLSIAVFGPPGAGKSFAIKQMAREWTSGGAKIMVLEFNLSQFSSTSDMPAALQRVRDCAVEGALPLVFWDEFDTALSGRELGWLSQFLAPMQDGAFIEGGVARPIGPAVFIFAGGTHAKMASFKQRAVEIPGAKATDFLSRLRGFVDILGPNPMHANDATFILRRALLLRALLQSKAPGLMHGGRLDIDPGVLRAFLNVATYVHGARSMESVVDMSALSGKLRYERSALPPQHQLDLHVAAGEFLALVHADADEEMPVDARRCHA